MTQDAYTQAGVSQSARRRVRGRPRHAPRRRSTPASRRGSCRCPVTTRACCGSTRRPGIAFGTDGVGTKMVVAEELGRFETIGIDLHRDERERPDLRRRRADRPGRLHPLPRGDARDLRPDRRGPSRRRRAGRHRDPRRRDRAGRRRRLRAASSAAPPSASSTSTRSSPASGSRPATP